jgi:hypothetical protein
MKFSNAIKLHRKSGVRQGEDGAPVQGNRLRCDHGENATEVVLVSPCRSSARFTAWARSFCWLW